MPSIKVSIITVCYNSANTIEQTIRSVLGQSYGNIEYIIIDGGSTDGTVDVIKKFASFISFWSSEPDHGIYDAMNKGITKATGDIIGFINSDDWYADGAISAIVEAYNKTDADIIYGHTILVDNGIQTLRIRPPLEHIFYGMVFCHQAAFAKTKLMKEHPFDISYKIVADYVFFLEMYLQKKIFLPIDTTIAYFRMGGDSSHPWKLYQEARRASLQLSKGRIDKERYWEIRDSFQTRRIFPVFRFLISKMTNLSQKEKDVMIARLNPRSFVLYGAGQLGREVLSTMKTFKLQVAAFWDSDGQKQGLEIDNVPILCPKQNKQQGLEITILITTVKGNEEIAKKLEAFGYERGRDFFDMKTWLSWMAGIWLGKCG